ncbi:MAG: hypothetical protein FK734_00695 [Asgard group archaeon]|nr:hypothetical protein [Asgard group archaeon]
MNSITRNLLIIFLLLITLQPLFVSEQIKSSNNQRTIPKVNSYFSVEDDLYDPLEAEIFIGSDEELDLLALNGSGTAFDPYRLEKRTIITNKLYAIYVRNITKHLLIQHNQLQADYVTIKVELVTTDSVIIHNNTGSQSFIGACIKFTDNIVITNNTFSDNIYGINCNSLSNCLYQYNHLINNNIGINLESNCSYLLISDNWFVNNLEGIHLANCQQCIIQNNIIRNNSLGIFMETTNQLLPTTNCSIRYNLFENNTGYGISIIDFISQRCTNNNIFHHNTFANNNLGEKQTFDEGIDNQWYNNKEGNYWSDWWGLGSYKIPGEAKSEDLFPLNKPLHGLVTNVPRLLKGRVIIFTVFTPILISGYVFIRLKNRKPKIKE